MDILYIKIRVANLSYIDSPYQNLIDVVWIMLLRKCLVLA
ncbi:hypothetical protein F7308_0789 [Francisella salina]|uniref:Uncharacterized protein n=1 Tax=Francisella salina TaxID=573569 RepID=A0ABM5M929_FRAST|nr:hypothetical protein F7308_0789 [Francisella salina]